MISSRALGRVADILTRADGSRNAIQKVGLVALYTVSVTIVDVPKTKVMRYPYLRDVGVGLDCVDVMPDFYAELPLSLIHI